MDDIYYFFNFFFLRISFEDVVSDAIVYLAR